MKEIVYRKRKALAIIIYPFFIFSIAKSLEFFFLTWNNLTSFIQLYIIVFIVPIICYCGYSFLKNFYRGKKYAIQSSLSTNPDLTRFKNYYSNLTLLSTKFSWFCKNHFGIDYNNSPLTDSDLILFIFILFLISNEYH